MGGDTDNRGIVGLLDGDMLVLRGLLRNSNEVRKQHSDAGKAASKRYKGLRDLALDIYTELCLLSGGTNLVNQIRFKNADEIRQVILSIRPPYKVFSKEFFRRAESIDWDPFQGRWIEVNAQKGDQDTTLYQWWKNLNKDLKAVLQAWQ